MLSASQGRSLNFNCRLQAAVLGYLSKQYVNAQKPRDFISSLDTQDGDKSPRFEVKNW